ncbi:serine hydrolase domain-containing protein [Aquimarina intermedia]|uniref:CubicO group peptidase (Beta-lactamase class C family) n=1 Tax=Aquimarina intermedia TaxID=350814 RepID=A0A5S5C5H1_9FLAO|nr:serine hydrolase domain-containing protein [Aquimarina intermedia]TYP74389.1 CubicO group peptidase (beta-lactamase class C family) [Aquimarina intermedia]
MSGYSQSISDIATLEISIKNKISNKEIPSVVFAVSKNGKTIYQKAFGKADIANNISATINTTYQIASISKALTVTGIMVLDEQNIIDIDLAAENYMGKLRFQNFFDVKGTVTVRNLLDHTSGFGTYFDISYADESRPIPSFEEAFDTFGTLHHPPNLISEYSNLGYGLLDYIITTNSGKTYHAFMQEKVFDPLGMKHSYVQGYKNSLKEEIQEAKKYTAGLVELPDVINNTPGSGNIYTSITDLIQFGNFHLKTHPKTILSAQGIEQIHNYKNPDALFHYHKYAYYGLGWYVKPNDNGYRIVWHEGGMMGASATLKLIPEEKIAITVMINSSNRTICNEIVDELTKIVLPAYSPTKLNEITEISEYRSVVNDERFLGTWSGNVTVDSLQIPFSLNFKEDGSTIASYLDHTYKS